MVFRERLFTSIIILISAVIFCLLSTGVALMLDPLQETYNRNSLVRLHVVANSNSHEDQILKLKVRDRIIKATEPLMLKVENNSEAVEILSKNLRNFESVARDEVIKNGRNLTVKASLGRFPFPKVAYPFGVLPAGEYQGIKVILGEGSGKNWWCVLYPPLCLLDPDAPTFKGNNIPEATKVEYHFALLEDLVKQKNLTLNQFWKGWGDFFGLTQ